MMSILFYIHANFMYLSLFKIFPLMFMFNRLFLLLLQTLKDDPVGFYQGDKKSNATEWKQPKPIVSNPI